MGDIELVYWDNHHCTISRARSSANWAISAHDVYRLKGSGSCSYRQELLGRGLAQPRQAKPPLRFVFHRPFSRTNDLRYIHISLEITFTDLMAAVKAVLQ